MQYMYTSTAEMENQSVANVYAPCPVIARVHFDGPAIGFDRSRGVLEFDVLVAHQGPCRQIPAVDFQGALEILDRLFMRPLSPFEAVVVSDDAASLGSVLVDPARLVCKMAQLRPALLHVQDVRVDVNVIQSEWVQLAELLERSSGSVELCGRATGQSL